MRRPAVNPRSSLDCLAANGVTLTLALLLLTPLACVKRTAKLEPPRTGCGAPAKCYAEALLALDKGINQIRKQALPIGTILAFAGDHTSLKGTGWVVCNKANHEKFGQQVPNLTGLFLRGATASGTTGGDATYTTKPERQPHDHGRTPVSSNGFASGSDGNNFLPAPRRHSHNLDDVVPPYYSVVYIIRRTAPTEGP